MYQSKCKCTFKSIWLIIETWYENVIKCFVRDVFLIEYFRYDIICFRMQKAMPYKVNENVIRCSVCTAGRVMERKKPLDRSLQTSPLETFCAWQSTSQYVRLFVTFFFKQVSCVRQKRSKRKMQRIACFILF